MSGAQELGARIDALAWDDIERELAAYGVARTPRVLDAGACAEIARLYEDERRFRSTVVMARHNFGSGEYRYFAYPLPEPVQALRAALYRRLAPIANAWARALRTSQAFEDDLDAFLQRCHVAGQRRPTPLLLSYGEGDWNALHQDLYGEIVFPLQATCFLSRPGPDYEGGAFLTVEQRPRAQSRGTALLPAQGELVLFATRERPVQGARGYYRTALRHGVSRVTRGSRRTLGIVFHDAR